MMPGVVMAVRGPSMILAEPEIHHLDEVAADLRSGSSMMFSGFKSR